MRFFALTFTPSFSPSQRTATLPSGPLHDVLRLFSAARKVTEAQILYLYALHYADGLITTAATPSYARDALKTVEMNPLTLEEVERINEAARSMLPYRAWASEDVEL